MSLCALPLNPTTLGRRDRNELPPQSGGKIEKTQTQKKEENPEQVALVIQQGSEAFYQITSSEIAMEGAESCGGQGQKRQTPLEREAQKVKRPPT